MENYVNEVRLAGYAKWIKRGVSRKNGNEWLKFTLTTEGAKGAKSMHSVMAFGQVSSANVEDGSFVEVRGSISYSKWEKDGVTSWPATIWAKGVTVVGEREAYADAVDDWASSDDIPF